jgi:eukaryotic-like serine/threonine-protein kinase
VPPRAYVYAQLSPDGTKIAVDVRDQEQDVWIWDLARATLQRLTFDPGLNRVPVWSRDGHRLAFSRTLDNTEEVYWQSADGSGIAEPLTKGSKQPRNPSDFSPDGTMLLYTPANPPWGIWMVSVKGPATSGAPLLDGPANEKNPVVSPDGRWVAYESDESGQNEIYVRPFPAVSTGRWQISTNGGTRPRWSRNGRELFYYIGAGPRGTLMAVSVESSPTFRASTPKMLFQGNYPSPNAGGALYDISRDGQRFLMIKNSAGDEGAAALRQIVVVQHFDQELKRLVPRK